MTSTSKKTTLSSPNDSGRRAILDAAEELFASKGFAGASMRALARCAGVSQALIHHHFGTKSGLYDAVKCRFAERFPADTMLAIDRKEGDAPGSALRRGMLRYASWLKSNPNFQRITLWANLEGDLQPLGSGEAKEELPRQAAQMCTKLQEEGVLRSDLEPNLFMLLAGGVIEHWTHHRDALHNLLGGEIDIDELEEHYLNQAISVLLHGALSPGTTSSIGAPATPLSETRS